jgi:hypothetical protein
MNRFKEISIILFFVLFFSSCITPKKIIISDSEKNPTEYFFNISLDSMARTIEKVFQKQRYCGYFLDDNTSPFFKHIPNLDKNEHDYFLMIFTYSDVTCRSKVYYSRYGKPRLYHPYYYFVNLEEKDSGVKVYVYAINPQLNVGWRWGAGHSLLDYGFKPRSISVPSTTVEEYEILLMIGNTLGIQMPPLKIPKKIIVSSIF